MSTGDIISIIAMFFIIGVCTYYNYKFNQICKDFDEPKPNKTK